MRRRGWWAFVTVVFFQSTSCRPTTEDTRGAYWVRDVDDGAIDVDAALSELAWDEANVERGFSFPWQERDAPLTEFRGLVDNTYFYFSFRVDDADVVLVDDGEPGEDEAAVARGDRVELFFASEPDLGSYICFEIDPRGRVLDYRASYYREFDVEWDQPDVAVATELTETGYLVEGRIPRAALPTTPEGRVLTGIFRAEFSHRDDDQPRQEWISWIRPSSDEPDFHIPSAFGWLEIR